MGFTFIVLLAGLVGVLTLIGVWGIAVHNGLVQLHHRVKGAWAQIDVLLRRRNDLLLTVLEAARAHTSKENETLDRINQARTQALGARGLTECAQAERNVSEAVAQFAAMSQQYPSLKADPQLQELQQQLSSAESRIGTACQSYNDIVTAYNAKLQSLPTSYIAKLFAFSAEDVFQVESVNMHTLPQMQHAA